MASEREWLPLTEEMSSKEDALRVVQDLLTNACMCRIINGKII